MPNLPRFFCDQLPHPRLSDCRCVLDPEQTRHARKILRLRPGATLEVFDGRGLIGRATLQAYEGGQAVCVVSSVDTVEPALPQITIAAALPKGSRADEMIHLLGQIGCDRFIPLLTARSEVDPRGHKLERFQRGAITAAKQSGRPRVMDVASEARPLASVLTEAADVRLIAAIGDFGLDDLPAKVRAARSVVVLIGPVGDWTQQEIADAREAGFSAWTLGPYVLRVETAAASATAILRYLAMQPDF